MTFNDDINSEDFKVSLDDDLFDSVEIGKEPELSDEASSEDALLEEALSNIKLALKDIKPSEEEKEEKTPVKLPEDVKKDNEAKADDKAEEKPVDGAAEKPIKERIDEAVAKLENDMEDDGEEPLPVLDFMREPSAPGNDDSKADGGNDNDTDKTAEDDKQNKFKLAPIIFLSVVFVISAFALWFVKTDSGRRFGYKLVAKFVLGNASSVDLDRTGDDVLIRINTESNDYDAEPDDPERISQRGDKGVDEALSGDNSQSSQIVYKEPRREDYVSTFLLVGIENINDGANTDAMMLLSINTKDNTIKLTSLLRDTYVYIPGYNRNKLNAVYAKVLYEDNPDLTWAQKKDKAASTLVKVIENTYDIGIDGYATVNFDGFENIIDLLGGIWIDLGETEAEYLNKTNYISKEENRNVVPGGMVLNGNQALGYVRVRKVPTKGGYENDYGRTVRQRRVISAIIREYKDASFSSMLSIMKKALGQVFTNITEDQLSDLLYDVVENKIFTIKECRLPGDGLFYDSGKEGSFNGKNWITYTLVIDGNEEANIKKLHQFVFLDSE